ncbi:MAG: hypothetical protein M3373_08295, partial [Gemmatimonadota bacterium]|nr:hypothetical protein [Gemmatimonadota bacterium]
MPEMQKAKWLRLGASIAAVTAGALLLTGAPLGAQTPRCRDCDSVREETPARTLPTQELRRLQRHVEQLSRTLQEDGEALDAERVRSVYEQLALAMRSLELAMRAEAVAVQSARAASAATSRSRRTVAAQVTSARYP